jgi:hypothetical protein
VAFIAPPKQWIQRVYQPDWAGPVLFAPGAKPLQIPAHRFCAVEGEWMVPKARPTINCSNRWEQTDGSSLWIAIDGWMATFKAHDRINGKWHTCDSTDILQAGSESDVHCYHRKAAKYPTSAYFWIEWSGTRNIAVAKHSRNLPLHPGDTIYVRIAADTAGPRAWRRATLWLVNETTGFYLPPRTFDSGCVDCGTPFSRRDRFEWRRLRSEAFQRCDAEHRLDDVERHSTLAAGTLLACAAIDGPQTATFSRAPYAISTPGQQGDLEPKPKHC